MSAGNGAAAVTVLSLFASLVAGCEYDPPVYPEVEPVETATTFALRGTGGSVLMARVDASDVVGADVSLARFGEAQAKTAIRGHASGRMVNVQAGEGRVTGLVSGGPVELVVAHAEDALVFEGLVRGRISAFRIDAATARGTLGRCSYELARVSHEYEGRRSCGGHTEGVSLRIPDALERWSDDERAAVLAILLDRG